MKNIFNLLLFGVFILLFVQCEKENLNFNESYVDLGLSVNWATCNIGANSPEDFGYYVAWGECKPKKYYDCSNYKYCKKAKEDLTKYNDTFEWGVVDNKSELEFNDDVVNVNLGDGWRIPTFKELGELVSNCTWEWTMVNGVYGYKVIGRNGNFIFLPAAGFIDEYGYEANVGVSCYYWSNTLYRSWYSWYLYANSIDARVNGNMYRCYGCTIRPVLSKTSK